MVKDKIDIPFRHFSMRLHERYGVFITFEEYLELNKIKYLKKQKIIKNKEGKRRLIGYCNIKNVNVLCCRSINSKIFITALPFENKF
jgi:hypothetical protein